MEKPYSIKVTPDAHYAIKNLKKTIKNQYDRSYSASDLIVVGALSTLALLDVDPPIVMDILEQAKSLRLRKNRGEENSLIFEMLKDEALRKLRSVISSASSEKNKIKIVEIVESFIDKELPEAATLVLFEFKEYLDEQTFKDLAKKIIEVQARVLKEKGD